MKKLVDLRWEEAREKYLKAWKLIIEILSPQLKK